MELSFTDLQQWLAGIEISSVKRKRPSNPVTAPDGDDFKVPLPSLVVQAVEGVLRLLACRCGVDALEFQHELFRISQCRPDCSSSCESDAPSRAVFRYIVPRVFRPQRQVS